MYPSKYPAMARTAAAAGAWAAAWLVLAGAAHAAIVPDRTRVIFNEGEPSAVVTIANKNEQCPYLVQSWIEDEQGRRITSPLMVVPPLERVEAGERNVLRIARIPGAVLPTDRESVFYLNIREIPPKANVPNALQIALQTQMKLFWRPKGVQPARDEDPTLPMNLRIDTAAQQLVFDNPTPYHVTVIGLAVGAADAPQPLDPVMVSPKAQARVPFHASTASRIIVTHIDDYGGQVAVNYVCEALACRSVKP